MISEHHTDYDLRNQRKIWRTPQSVATIGDKIVETLSSSGVTSENKTIHTPPLPFPVGVFSTRSSNSGTTLHGGGGGGKAFFT